ncbi:leucine-rich repeat extensin-like protein 3 [Limulus polyphemus]|uniref:Leucine-rich repeat extensin-like protein 3 n=1 Tax=Limulus polyphemus TaxID=6850 RepID=A0ABM1BG71_LIMPO|nr:leucine-rich repeat extensin-like protein 3 [Limulus polyphemus]
MSYEPFTGTLQEKLREVDQLWSDYNKALQDKTEAQTKLDVLTSYFKEKEMQLQRELGAQEVMRQRKEKDASSAERHVALIEQENSSYKAQLATMKQEMDETNRNFKNQIAAEEKKAHDNWIAARAAERKLEEAKQEAASLRQRLTLVERDRESFGQNQTDGVVKPISTRLVGPNGELDSPPVSQSLTQNSLDAEPGPRPLSIPPCIDNPPLPRLPLPLDRPIPPPPLHPLDPMLRPHFFPRLPFDDRLPPPHFLPDPMRFTAPPPYDRRFSPSYDRERSMTSPRGPYSPPLYRRDREREIDRHSTPPRDSDQRSTSDRFSPPPYRDSRSSSPPHPLPKFHDIPPLHRILPPFPPPLGSLHMRPPPMLRRDLPPDFRPGSRSSDISTSSPRSNQQPSQPRNNRNGGPSTEV